MPIKVIHIGVGMRGRNWLDYVRDYPDAITVACVDSDPKALDAARTKVKSNQCAYFTDLDVALRTVSADAALIASPSDLHASHALKAMEAGMAIMVEKPLATSFEDAVRVVQRAKDLGRSIMVAENFRYVPAERTIRKLIREGLLGEVASATLIDRRRQPTTMQGSWVNKMEYPHLIEIAIHHFDSLRSYFGRQPIAVTAQIFNPSWSDYRSGACTHALIEMEGGLQIQYLGTLTSHRYSYSLWVEGERGVLWSNRKWVLYRPRGSRWFRPVRLVKVLKGDEAPYPQEGTTSLLNSLRGVVLHGQEAETSGKDNLWTIAMLCAGIRSAKEKRTVTIREIFDFSGYCVVDE